MVDMFHYGIHPDSFIGRKGCTRGRREKEGGRMEKGGQEGGGIPLQNKYALRASQWDTLTMAKGTLCTRGGGQSRGTRREEGGRREEEGGTGREEEGQVPLQNKYGECASQLDRP
jgi:hypothetical protein